MASNISCLLTRPSYFAPISRTFTNCQKLYAAKKSIKEPLGAAAPGGGKERLSVETDPQKLHDYVCGANFRLDQEPIKVKEDHEYPDWLWELHIGKPLTLDEMDPSTKQYWKKLRTLAMKRNNQLKKLRKF